MCLLKSFMTAKYWLISLGLILADVYELNGALKSTTCLHECRCIKLAVLMIWIKIPMIPYLHIQLFLFWNINVHSTFFLFASLQSCTEVGAQASRVVLLIYRLCDVTRRMRSKSWSIFGWIGDRALSEAAATLRWRGELEKTSRSHDGICTCDGGSVVVCQ